MKIEFKYIRNQIRNYSLDSILSQSVKRIKHLERHPNKAYPIWNIFTLIRWSFIYAGDKYPSKYADDKATDRLLKLISDLSDSYKADGLSVKERLPKFLSAISKQQLWLQSEFHISMIYRQLLLFRHLKSRYDIDNSFYTLSGLDTLQFLKFCFITQAYIQPDIIDKTRSFNGFFPVDYYDNLSQVVSKNKSDCFLKLLTLGTEESIDFLKKENRKLSNGLFQVYDTSFLTRFPFVLINGAESIIHRSVFTNTIQFFLYDYLKSNDPRFSEEFGKRMEQYIELGLKEISANYITENQIKRLYPDSKKQVDFLIDANILIESKAIELKSLPAIIPDNNVLTKSLEDSIIKAYSKQMMTLCNSINKKMEYYGIIITYKQLELGNGRICWDTFLKEATENFCADNGFDCCLLPPQNLFIIDIQTWDEIVQIIKDGKVTLINLLKKVRAADDDLKTSKYFLSMHLDEYTPFPFKLDYFKIVENDLMFTKSE